MYAFFCFALLYGFHVLRNYRYFRNKSIQTWSPILSRSFFNMFPEFIQHSLRDSGAMRYVQDGIALMFSPLLLFQHPNLLKAQLSREFVFHGIRYSDRNLLDIYTPLSHRRDEQSDEYAAETLVDAVSRLYEDNSGIPISPSSTSFSASLPSSASPATSSKQQPAQFPLAPVLIFVHGGAWSSGSRFMYRMVGRCFQQRGILTVILGYSYYPHQDTIGQMDQIKAAVHFCHEHIAHYGGDPHNMFLFGHSSGAHVAILSAFREAGVMDPHLPRTCASIKYLCQLRGIIGLSGPYNIESHFQVEFDRGVAELSAMQPSNGRRSMFSRFSPEVLAEGMGKEALRGDEKVWKLPPMFLIHGEDDAVVPFSSSIKLEDAMKKAFERVMGNSHNPHQSMDALIKCKIMRGIDHSNFLLHWLTQMTRLEEFNLAEMNCSVADEIVEYIRAAV